jgi:hypothetical protein
MKRCGKGQKSLLYLHSIQRTRPKVEFTMIPTGKCGTELIYHPQRFVVHLLRPPRSPVELEGLVLHFRRALHIAPYGTPAKAIIQSLEQFVLVLAIDSVLIFEAMLVWEPCCLHRSSACRSPTGAGSPRWRGANQR